MSSLAIALIVAVVVLTGISVDLFLARNYYQLQRDIRGWRAVRRWTEKRSKIMKGVAALYLLFVVVLFGSDLVNLPGVQFTSGSYLFRAGMTPNIIALLVALGLLIGVGADLLVALRYYGVKRGIRGWEAIKRWAERRVWVLGGAAVLYLVFAWVLFFTDLIRLPGVRFEGKEFDFGSLLTPRKIALFTALIFLGGFTADLLLAWKYYRLKHNIRGWEAVRRWFGRRAWFLGGAAALYLTFAGVLLFTDLIRLPGVRHETNSYVVSAGKYLKERKYPEAALELRNALRKNPDDTEVRLTLARTLHTMGRLKEAEPEYRAVISAHAAAFPARFGLAQLLLRTERKEPALAELREAIRLQPAAVEPHLLLARILRKDGDYLQALEECRRALAAKPDHQATRELFLSIALEGKFYAEALREAGTGRKTSPGDIKLLAWETLALQGLGRTGEADALLREYASGNRQAAHPWLFLGDLLYQRKEYQAALGCYEEVLKREPDDATAMNNVAALSAGHGGDLKRAHKLAALLNWKYPDNPGYADTLGWVLVKQGQATQALPYLRRAVAGKPKNPEIRYHFGTALVKSGNLASGKKELTEALRLGSDFDGADQAQSQFGREK
jgi:tetratricopeptide (TPR) repeat protein